MNYMNSLGEKLMAVLDKAINEDIQRSEPDQENIKWHCCGRFIKSNFCPHCGSKKVIPKHSALSKSEAVSAAIEMCNKWEHAQITQHNTASGYQRRAEKLLKESKRMNKDSREYDQIIYEAERSESTASTCETNSLRFGHWVKTVRHLIDIAENQ